jgi:hypothetical protein
MHSGHWSAGDLLGNDDLRIVHKAIIVKKNRVDFVYLGTSKRSGTNGMTERQLLPWFEISRPALKFLPDIPLRGFFFLNLSHRSPRP